MKIDPYKYEERYKRWKEKLERLIASGKYANTQTEIEDLLDDLEHDIDTYKNHLIEARTFLNKYDWDFYTQPYQDYLDESVDILNNFINELNEKVREYNNR